MKRTKRSKLRTNMQQEQTHPRQKKREKRKKRDFQLAPRGNRQNTGRFGEPR